MRRAGWDENGVSEALDERIALHTVILEKPDPKFLIEVGLLVVNRVRFLAYRAALLSANPRRNFIDLNYEKSSQFWFSRTFEIPSI